MDWIRRKRKENTFDELKRFSKKNSSSLSKSEPGEPGENSMSRNILVHQEEYKLNKKKPF